VAAGVAQPGNPVGEVQGMVVLDVVALSGRGEEGNDDLAQPGGGFEQEASLQGPGGDIDEGSVEESSP
jgi:hypothetical protein